MLPPFALTPDQLRSRRVRAIRPRTENLRRISPRRLEMIRQDAAELDDEGRPHTRGDCVRVIRPCSFVACKFNLYLDVSPNGRSIKLTHPDLEPGEMAVLHSCALDVADRGGASLHETAAAMNMVRERVRQIANRALAKLAPLIDPERVKTEEETMTTAKKKAEGRKFELELPCRLSTDELLGKGELIAKLHEEALGLRMRKKAASDEIGGEIKAREGTIGVLVAHIRTRSEVRAVHCVEELDFKSGVVTTKRLDTRDVVATRTMTPTERQPSLFETIPGGKDEKGKKKNRPRKPLVEAAQAEATA